MVYGVKKSPKVKETVIDETVFMEIIFNVR